MVEGTEAKFLSAAEVRVECEEGHCDLAEIFIFVLFHLFMS